MDNRFSSSAMDLVRAKNLHEFPEPAGRLLDWILSFMRRHGEPPRWLAIIPRQSFLSLFSGASKGRTSQLLTWLERQRVIERQPTKVIVQGHRQCYTLCFVNEPAQWSVSRRVQDSQLLADAIAWLDGMSLDQGELLPPSETLNDLLRESFLDRHHSPSRVDPAAVRSSPPEPASSPGGNQVASPQRVGRLWAAVEQAVRTESVSDPKALVPPGGTQRVEVPSQGTAEVPSGGTRARVEPNRVLESKSTCVHSTRVLDRVEQVSQNEARSAASQDAAARLWRCIGRHEQTGNSRYLWNQAIDQIPYDLQELIGHIEMLEREGRPLDRPVAWLNTSVRNALRFHQPVRITTSRRAAGPSYSPPKQVTKREWDPQG